MASRAVRGGPIAVLAALAALAVAACGAGASPTPAASSPPASVAPVETAAPSAAAEAPNVTVATSPTLGQYLTGKDGLALYLFKKDTGSTSTCYDKCATAWPPLLVGEGQTATGGDGVTGTFGNTKRTDGTLQVTYNGVPLYYFQGDKAAGDTTGQGLNDVWFVVSPAGAAVAPSASPSASSDDNKVTVATSATLGKYLAGKDGLALYIFKKDTGSTSTCYDACATAWPPLVVAAGQSATGEDGVTGTFATTTRTDGTLQVTYNGVPLYYFQGDKAAGDTTGQGLNDVWFVATP